MDYRIMGRTGLKVSELCLGTMTFGRETNETDSFAIMDAFKAAGGNFLDSADVYTRGASEEIVGKWLKTQTREDFIVATKARFPMGEGPNDIGLSRKHLLFAVEESLKRLQLDYIDLYQVHCWDPLTPLEETLSTLDGLVKSGKVRYIGVSNFKPSQIQLAADLCKMNGWAPFVCLQPLYNLLDREIEWEIVEVCEREGLGIIPWSPLRGGWLTGKYRRGMESAPEGTRIEIADEKGWTEGWSNYAKDRTWNVIEALVAVAEALDKSPAQVALNWVKDRPGVTAPIIGARRLSQVEDNLNSVGWALSDEHRARLDEVSDMPGPYPFDFIATNGART